MWWWWTLASGPFRPARSGTRSRSPRRARRGSEASSLAGRTRPRPHRALGAAGVRRAPCPFSLFVPRRRLAARRAGGARRGARLRGAGADRSRRRVRLARVCSRGESLRRPADHRRGGDTRRRLDGAEQERRCRLCRRRSERRLARDAAGRIGSGVRESLPAADRGARQHARRSRPGPAVARRSAAGGAERRPGLPLGLRAPWARRPAPERGGRAGAGLWAGALLRRAAVPLRAWRRAAECGPARPGRVARRPDGCDRRRPRPSPAADGAAGRPGRDPLPHLPRRLRGRAAREPRERPARAGGGGGALSARPRRGGARRRAGRAARVRPDRGSRLPLPGLLRQRRARDRTAPPRV